MGRPVWGGAEGSIGRQAPRNWICESLVILAEEPPQAEP